MTDISSQATCPPDSSTLIPTENIIEDIFAFTNDFWSVPGNHNGPLGTLQPLQLAPASGGNHNKTRLNSYEESLSSPESGSGFSNRSRVSSGEDDLGETQAWNSKNSSYNSGGHPKSADNQQQQWTYIAVTPSSEESIPIHTSSFKSVVSNLLPPGSAVNGENDFDPSLTELNAILEGTTQVRMEYQDQTVVEHSSAEPHVGQQTVEWTYLEPAQPTFELNPQTTRIEEVGIPNNQGYTTEWELSTVGNNYGSNPAVIVQPAWPPHVVTTTAEGQNGGPNQRINGEIQYEIIEAHEVKTPTNLTRVVTMQPTSLHNAVHHHGHHQISNTLSAKVKKTLSTSSNNAMSSKSVKDDKPRICHVCGEQAGKHSYYGGQVCPSCRAFFRRSVQSKYSDIYKCSKGGHCAITLKTRKNCQFCRFQACEKAGMKRSWVLADGDPTKTKNKSGSGGGGSPTGTNALSPNSSSNSHNSSTVSSTTSFMPASSGTLSSGLATSSSTSSNASVCSILSTKDENKIRHCIEKMEMIKQQTEDLNPQVMEEFVSLVKNSNPSCLSKESGSAMKKVLEQRSRLFALNVPEFVSLSSNDQVVLQEENIGPLIELRVATFFHTEIKARRQADLLLGQGDMLRLTSSLDGLHETQRLDNQHLEYEQFFDHNVDIKDQISSNNDKSTKQPQRDMLQVMSEHKSLIHKISKWVEDETTFCLMNLILLFNTSGSRRQLQSPDLVESHQIEYAQLLYRYLSSRYAKSKARAKLAEGIRLVSHCRELHQLAFLRCSMSRKFSESQSSTTSEDC